MSDTHLRHKVFPLQVPEADILIHSGDACLNGTAYEFREFMEWFGSLKARIAKIFVAGNHDVLFEKQAAFARSLIPKEVTYLQDDPVEIEGLKIYGSPWQPEFCDWSFNLPRGHRLREKWNKIPRDTDVLVTHGPPMGVLDLNYDGEHVGCADLRDVVERVKPRLHVFGHIHGDYGQAKLGRTLFVNASICDEAYRPIHDPVVVEIQKAGDAMLVPWTSGPKTALPMPPAEPLW
jgi:Icc-related predicted phosphoesterase